MTPLEIDLDKTQDVKQSTEIRPFDSSQEHLWASLTVAERLMRAHLVRCRLNQVSLQAAESWGMLSMSAEEAEHLLNAPFFPPHAIPAGQADALRPYWAESQHLAAIVAMRLAQHDNIWPLRLMRLTLLANLSEPAQYVLWLCLLAELDVRYARLVGYFHDDLTQSHLTVALAQQLLKPLLPDEPEAAVHAVQTLRQASLLLEAPFLKVAPRFVTFVQGSDMLTDPLSSAAQWHSVSLPLDTLNLSAKKRGQLNKIAAWWQTQLEPGTRLFLYGPQGSGRLKAAIAMSSAWKRPLFCIDVRSALNNTENWPQFVQQALWEAKLSGGTVAWSGCERLRQREHKQAWRDLLTAVAAYPYPVFLLDQHYWHPDGQTPRTPFFRIEFSTLSFSARLDLWRTLLADLDIDSKAFAETLANSFQFTEGQIEAAFVTAHELALIENGRLTLNHFFTACRRESEQHLIQMAQRIEPRSHLTFDDLILPSACRRQLDELRQRMQLRQRVHAELGFEKRLTLGKGLVALFSGASGTGKTMAAELLAREQGVDLYKVDLSAVVSKYVGETEKNLNRVFAEAEDANAIILFDEADALFGKRSEVKDARDRWANMEVNYLLQRVEEYQGSVILTSNFQQNIDEAFLRRIQMVIPFPFPTAKERFLIWKGMFPADVQAPPDDALQLLSERFELSGGSLKNIVVDAAYRALVDDNTAVPTITVRHVVAAIGREYQKLGQPIMRGLFGEEFYGWLEDDIL